MLHLGEIEVFSGAAPEPVQDVNAGRLEVWGRVVALWHEQLWRNAIIDRFENVTDLDELLLDGAKECDTWRKLKPQWIAVFILIDKIRL